MWRWTSECCGPCVVSQARPSPAGCGRANGQCLPCPAGTYKNVTGSWDSKSLQRAGCRSISLPVRRALRVNARHQTACSQRPAPPIYLAALVSFSPGIALSTQVSASPASRALTRTSLDLGVRNVIYARWELTPRPAVLTFLSASAKKAGNKVLYI